MTGKGILCRTFGPRTLPLKPLVSVRCIDSLLYRFLWLFEPLSSFYSRHPTAVTPLFAATCTCPTVCDRARTPDLDNKNLEKMKARKKFWSERTGLPRVARTWRAHNSRSGLSTLQGRNRRSLVSPTGSCITARITGLIFFVFIHIFRITGFLVIQEEGTLNIRR